MLQREHEATRGCTKPQNNGVRFPSVGTNIAKKVRGKAVPLQAWSGPEGSRKLTFPDLTTTEQDGGNVVSRTHRPPLPQEIDLELISVRG